MKNIKELVVSLIRTSLVPPVAGFVLAWLTSHHVTAIHSEWVFTVVTVVLTGLWYVIFRAIELINTNPTVKKWAGVFLGYPRVTVKTGDVKEDKGQANIYTVLCVVLVVILIVVLLKYI